MEAEWGGVQNQGPQCSKPALHLPAPGCPQACGHPGLRVAGPAHPDWFPCGGRAPCRVTSPKYCPWPRPDPQPQIHKVGERALSGHSWGDAWDKIPWTKGFVLSVEDTSPPHPLPGPAGVLPALGSHLRSFQERWIPRLCCAGPHPAHGVHSPGPEPPSHLPRSSPGPCSSGSRRACALPPGTAAAATLPQSTLVPTARGSATPRHGLFVCLFVCLVKNKPWKMGIFISSAK